MDDLNLYAYVGNNPASWIEPLGYARSDYVVNPDGSVTFATLANAQEPSLEELDEQALALYQQGK